MSMIEKSGTGIEKSGTGIGKSGTGVRAGGLIAGLALAALSVLSSPVAAGDSELFVTTSDGNLLVSMHGVDGIQVGISPLSSATAGYYTVPLYSAIEFEGGVATFGKLVQGSGSGDASEGCAPGSQLMVQGSGSGASGEGCGSGFSKMVQGSGSGKEVQGSGSGKEVQGSGSGKDSCQVTGNLLVQGSGSGSSNESTGSGTGSGGQLMVQGSGSGASGESVGQGGQLMVQGSGSGDASEGIDAGCAAAYGVWGVAEVVVDSDGVHVIVHQLDENGFREHLVAFVTGDHIENHDDGKARFVLTP